ncbi:MAG: response regulator transcription factor [Firmicutes bacterium]|nr:response regulator transcription factor [Bacillota bacterium]
MGIKILIADDHKLMREGLKALLGKDSQFNIVGEASDGRVAIKLIKELNPQLVIMDLSMPDMNGIDATEQICSDNPFMKIIILSMHKDKNLVKDALSAGASGYILKDCAFQELHLAINAVMNGQVYLSNALKEKAIEDYVELLKKDKQNSNQELTSREREILQMIAEGKTSKDISISLGISLNTVNTHRNHIMEKLGIDNIAQLTKYAIRLGLTSMYD